ncbi:MAG: hypothetical protein Q9178_001877 [Gyalolechia marmorata]
MNYPSFDVFTEEHDHQHFDNVVKDDTIRKRYLLYDIDTVTWLRRTHNILGVFIGSLPQSPQQNVFLGLPLELQPEEATLLVEKGLAFIVDDFQSHKKAIKTPSVELANYKAAVRKEGYAAAKAVVKHKQLRTQEALQRLKVRQAVPDTDNTVEKEDHDASIFDTPPESSSDPTSSSLIPYSSTPTTSYPPILAPSEQASLPLPEVSASSYALFKHLHSFGYFMSPGLRFGCQFSVYPGDPLRFHSHFLATSYDWDEEIDLLGLIGGGRLGTGVKKGWLIGGAVKNSDDNEKPDPTPKDDQSQELKKSKGSNVRTFCIEWGGM